MSTYDITRAYPDYYKASATKPQLLNLPPACYASMEGKGDPSGPTFAERVQALYTVAYTLKFLCKAQGNDFKVPKLEALWWYDMQQYPGLTMQESPLQVPRSAWHYRLLIRLPEYVDEAILIIAVNMAVIKKRLPFIPDVSWYELHEGRCVQLLHKGPFDREPETLARLQLWMQEQHLVHYGLHHEIYLSDFRKTSPDHLRTILRTPVL